MFSFVVPAGLNTFIVNYYYIILEYGLASERKVFYSGNELPELPE